MKRGGYVLVGRGCGHYVTYFSPTSREVCICLLTNFKEKVVHFVDDNDLSYQHIGPFNLKKSVCIIYEPHFYMNLIFRYSGGGGGVNTFVF